MRYIDKAMNDEVITVIDHIIAVEKIIGIPKPIHRKIASSIGAAS